MKTRINLLSPASRVFLVGSLLYLSLGGVIASLFVTNLDSATPYGTSYTFSVSTIPDSLSKRETIILINDVATESRTSIYKMSVSVDDPDRIRVLYRFGKMPEGNSGCLTRNYPDVNPALHTKILPAGQIDTEDLRGLYAVCGTKVQFADVLGSLKKLGLAPTTEAMTNQSLALRIISQNPQLTGALSLLLAAMATTAGYFASGRRKGHVVRVLHGAPWFKREVFELGTIAFAYIGAALLVLLVALPFLAILNGLAQFERFLGGFAFIAAVGLATNILVHGLTLLWFRTRSIPQVLSGSRPWKELGRFSSVITALSLIVLFAAIGSIATQTSYLNSESRFDQDWLAARGNVTLRFSGNTTEKDFRGLTNDFAALYSELAANGDAILVKPPTVPFFKQASVSLFDANSLIVNPAYLQHQHLHASSGSKAIEVSASKDEITLLVPSNKWERRDEVASSFRKWAEFQRSLRDDRPNSDLNVNLVEMRSGQAAFNFGANQFRFGAAQEDPIIAVLPVSNKIVSGDFYVTAASNGGIVFSDVRTLRNALKRHHLSNHVSGITSVSDLALLARSVRQSAISSALLAGLLMIVALISCSVVAVLAYVQRSRRVMFAKRICGHSFLKRHVRLLGGALASGSLALAVCCLGGLVSSPEALGTCLILLGAFESFMAVLVAIQESTLNKFILLEE